MSKKNSMPERRKMQLYIPCAISTLQTGQKCVPPRQRKQHRIFLFLTRGGQATSELSTKTCLSCTTLTTRSS